MRAAGLTVRMLDPGPYRPIVKAVCRVNEPALRRAFGLPDTISYKEGYDPERTPYDNPRADIFCTICAERADILTLHPDEWLDDTPWFPSPP